jgi:hypothetical protein
MNKANEKPSVPATQGMVRVHSKWIERNADGRDVYEVTDPPEVVGQCWPGESQAKLQKLTELFTADAQRFAGDTIGGDDLDTACGYWLCYPQFAESVGDNARGREPERATAYNALVSVHTRATEALMRVAETHSIDSTPLWESADLCRRLLSEPDGRYHVRRSSALKRYGAGWIVDPWPDCLEGCVADILPERIDAARRGLATLTRLSVLLEIKPHNPTESYLLLSEVCTMFGLSPKVAKTFCKDHHIPTKSEPRRFRISVVPFVTAYAQDTNVRTDAALRKRAARGLRRKEITSQLDSATTTFFGL